MLVRLPNDLAVRLFITHDRSAKTAKKHAAVTHAEVRSEAGAPLGEGAAVCHKGDQFKKHEGVKLAVRRALAATGLSKDQRRAVWARVWSNKYAR